MQRHRDIASAPARSASQTWETLSRLVSDTLTRSPRISAAQVAAALGAAAPAGMMLIAGGHLESSPLVLIVDELELTIATVGGDKAFSVEENLNPVPGAAQATDWTLHIPAPEPVGESIAALVHGVPHISTEAPTTSSAAASRSVGATASAASTGAAAGAAPSALNLDALAKRRGNQ